MKNMKIALVGLITLITVGCGNNDIDNIEIPKADFMYAGSINGKLYDTVYMSDVSYQITINPDGYTYGNIKFGSTIIEEFIGTTTSDGYFMAVDKNRKINDLGLPAAGPIIMDGTMITSNSVLVGGSGHWYGSEKIGNWSTN